MERYNEEKVTEETNKLKQLDRIEFRQKRIYNISMAYKEHLDFGLIIIMSMVYFTLALVSYSIDNYLFFTFLAFSCFFSIVGVYDYINKINKIKFARENLYEEYFNIKKIK